MDFGIAGVAAITVICYLAAQGAKATALDNKWLPVICGVLGGVLGVISCRTGPETIRLPVSRLELCPDWPLPV